MIATLCMRASRVYNLRPWEILFYVYWILNILLFEWVNSPQSPVPKISVSVGLHRAKKNRSHALRLMANLLLLIVCNQKVTMEFWNVNVSSSENVIISLRCEPKSEHNSQGFNFSVSQYPYVHCPTSCRKLDLRPKCKYSLLCMKNKSVAQRSA